MTTVAREIAENIAANDGWFDGERNDKRAWLVVKYKDQWGKDAWGVTFTNEAEESRERYLKGDDKEIKGPGEILWEHPDRKEGKPVDPEWGFMHAQPAEEKTPRPDLSPDRPDPNRPSEPMKLTKEPVVAPPRGGEASLPDHTLETRVPPGPNATGNDLRARLEVQEEKTFRKPDEVRDQTILERQDKDDDVTERRKALEIEQRGPAVQTGKAGEVKDPRTGQKVQTGKVVKGEPLPTSSARSQSGLAVTEQHKPLTTTTGKPNSKTVDVAEDEEAKPGKTDKQGFTPGANPDPKAGEKNKEDKKGK